MLRIQNVLGPSSRRRVRLAPFGAAPARPRPRLGTVGNVHAEEPDGAEGEDDDENCEDERVAPLSAGQLTTEHGDDADQESPDPGTDNVADASENSSAMATPTTTTCFHSTVTEPRVNAWPVIQPPSLVGMLSGP